MAKFRSNHQSKGRRNTQGYISRSIIYIVLIVVILVFLSAVIKKLKGTEFDSFDRPDKETSGDRFFLPEGSLGQVIHHDFYSLSYNEAMEQADWVAYKLTKTDLLVPNVKRSRYFIEDEMVRGQSAHHKDYSHSGYTRGHLAPAGDMAFSDDAMQQSFFMSNMSPQLRAFNNGIWKELEETVRDWAFKNEELYIVSGPIFDSRRPKQIGKNKIAVPDRFFKVILDAYGKEKKAIAFVIENGLSERLLSEYAVSIDEVEQITGFDYFANLLDDEIEDKLEGTLDLRDWRFSQKRHDLRIKHWNKQ